MYTKQLDTFLTVARLGSFSQAARALYITPSAVIQQVNLLEAELGATLLQRTSHGVSLTEAGRVVQRGGQRLVEQSNAIRAELQLLARRENEQVRVGVHLLRRSNAINMLWPRFAAQNPGCTVQYQELLPPQKGQPEIDLMESVCDAPAWRQEWHMLHICRMPLACAVAKGHPLANRAQLTFADLAPWPLVTIRASMGPELAQFYEDARSRGIRVQEVEQYDLAVFGMCEASGAVLQLPACWQDLCRGMVAVPCAWDYALDYGIFYRPGCSAAAQRFIDFARGELARRPLHWRQL